MPLSLLLLAACAAGDDGADAGGDAGDGTEDQSSIGMPDDGSECVCEDSATWTAPSGFGACATYAVGEMNEGYCDDDGATAHCPKACDACPECVVAEPGISLALLLLAIVCMAVCFGVPTAKYFVDLTRFSAAQYKRWRDAQDQKMSSLKTKNTIRKAKSKFIHLGVAGKLKKMSVASKFKKGPVAPVPADMRTEQEEAELAQLNLQIAKDREALQRFTDAGNGDSKPAHTLQTQVDGACARQTELHQKRPYDRELVQRMLQVKQEREAAEAALAAQSLTAQEAAQEGPVTDLERPLPQPELEPEPEPELELEPAASDTGSTTLRGDGHSHVFERNSEAHTEARVVRMGANERLATQEELVFKLVRDAMHAHRKMFGHTIDSTRAIFAAMDRHGNGMLSFDDFAEALRRLDIGLAREDIALIFNDLLPSDGLSAENGGLVRYHEFAQVLHGHATRAHKLVVQETRAHNLDAIIHN